MTGAGRRPSVRWPAAGVALGVVLVLVAFALDTGGSTARDTALLVGSLAFYAVLPLAVVWLVIVLVLRRRR